MVIFVLFFGVLTGTACAAWTLIIGQSIWMALLTYMVIGSASVLISAGLVVLALAQSLPEENPLPEMTPFRSRRMLAR